jgi:hypothetical protein
MCFKTAGLPAPSENKATTKELSNFAQVQVEAVGTRLVRVGLGAEGAPKVNGASSQYFNPVSLRELAAYLNELADALEA